VRLLNTGVLTLLGCAGTSQTVYTSENYHQVILVASSFSQNSVPTLSLLYNISKDLLEATWPFLVTFGRSAVRQPRTYLVLYVIF